jgi:uncharacterized protein YciI
MYVLELAFDGDERRLAARPAHRERLARLRAGGTLLMAGPWADDSGALLIFRTDESGLRDPRRRSVLLDARRDRRRVPALDAPRA